MKIQLDFDNKIIKIEGKEKLKDVIKTLDELQINWENWHLETSTVIDRWHYHDTYIFDPNYPK